MKDEQLEAWFESIESQLREIRKNQSNDNSDLYERTRVLFDDFVAKIRGIKFNLPSQDFEPLTQKIEFVLNEAKRISQPIMATHIKTEHYFLFFPDLKEWLFRLRRAKIIWLLAILLSASVFCNWYLWKDFSRYQTSDLKLRYMNYKGSIPLGSVLRNIDSAWAVPKFRIDALKFINQYESMTLQEQQKQQRILQLEKELKTLKPNQ